MDPAVRILTSPFRLTGEVDAARLGPLLAGDAIRRWSREQGLDVELLAATLAGDLASQHEAERQLLREGHDRASIGRDEFVEQVRAVEAAGRVEAERLLADFGVDVDLSTAAIDSEWCVGAARTAFVRLYEAGLVTATERVVDSCPHCMTVVEQPDADPAEMTVQALTVRLSVVDRDAGETFDVDVVPVELLPGAVAVAVPEGDERAGLRLSVPFGKSDVPVVTDPEAREARLVVPAHDSHAMDVARHHGLVPTEVLDEEGQVVADGPLLGLGRFAARSAATDLLEADGLVVARREQVEELSKCRRCGTMLVARLGRHWFLDMHDLEIAAADAAREGRVTFAPPAALDAFLDRAGAGGEWCLSHQLEAGQSVPVATCLDCGTVAPSLEPTESCGACMGTLVPDTAVLDVRFLAAIWPLAVAGWPAEERGVIDDGERTMLVVNPGGLDAWAVPMAALGLRLAGAVPFSRVGVSDGNDAAAWEALRPLVRPAEEL